MSSHRSSPNACTVCGKSVYSLEELKTNDQLYHKNCFKCSEEGCGLVLNLKTFKAVGSKVFCTKHAPVNKPTQTTISGNMSTLHATSAPKLQKAQGIKKNERMTFAPGELKPMDGSEQNE